MKADLNDRMPIYGMGDDYALNKQGDYTIGYRLHKRELFTLSEQDYHNIHQTITKAVQTLSPNTILHWQDWYSRTSFRPGRDDGPAWLSQASDRFFYERPTLSHESYLFITRRVQRPLTTSATSQLIRPRLVPKDSLDEQKKTFFRSQCSQFIRILEDSSYFKIDILNSDDFLSTGDKAGLLERYMTLSPRYRPTSIDVYMDEDLKLGHNHTRLYTLADPKDLPATCQSSIGYAPFSTEQTTVVTGFASPLGPLLPFDHICNHLMFITNAGPILKKLESRRLRLRSLAGYSRANASSADAIDGFLTEAAEGKTLLRTHTNCFAWTSDASELNDIQNRIASAMARLGAIPKLETVGAPQIWWGCLPGNEGDFPSNESYASFAEQSACFIQMESNYENSTSPFGWRLGDRLTGYPLNVDIDHEPRSRGLIGNFNTVCISGSGGGKSFCLNSLANSYYDQGGHIIILDVGHSYELQCQLHNGLYFTYEEDRPLAFNPFRLGAGETYDLEKKESLKNLLLALWKKAEEPQTKSEYVALSKALQCYFDKLNASDLFPCFNTFYEFMREDFTPGKSSVKETDFDWANFLFVLSPFYKGGEFENLLNATENLDLLDQRFVVFELDAIKDSPIYPIVSLIIIEIAVSKMRKLKNAFKTIIIEEAWKPIAEQGMGTFMQWLEKTARKFYTKIIVSTQEIEDLISSPILCKTIVNNSDTVILLDQSKLAERFTDLQQLLSITEKQKAEILSINQGRESGRYYKDLWIRSGASHSRVYRLEVPPEQYCIYTSEQREKHVIKEYARRYRGLRAGIQALIQEAAEKGTRLFPLMFLLLLPYLAPAQLPGIGSGASRVIKALDLQVQRIQTQTIWLQEAQKVVENAMSAARLDDIRSWVQAQKDLYEGYFSELWQIRSTVSGYYRLTKLVQQQEQLIASCKQALSALSGSKHLTAQEFGQVQSVYNGLMKETLQNLEQLGPVVKAFTTQMSDQSRLTLIDQIAGRMSRNITALQAFNDQNNVLILQRTQAGNDIHTLKTLYGL